SHRFVEEKGAAIREAFRDLRLFLVLAECGFKRNASLYETHRWVLIGSGIERPFKRTTKRCGVRVRLLGCSSSDDRRQCALEYVFQVFGSQFLVKNTRVER